QLGGDPYQLEQAIMQEYGNVDPNTIPQEEQQQLAAAMEAIDLYAAIDGQLAEAYPELLHKKFDGQYSAQGATSEQEVVAFLFRDIANTEQQLQEKISAWEQANGRPCLDQNTQQFDEGCAQDGAVSMLLMSYDALNTDLERRMFELGLDMDDQGQITQLTDDQGNPIRRYYQGSWSLNGFVMGPDGNPLMDSEGRPLVFEPGVDPEMAINGEVDPIGAYDAEIQDIVDAASAEGKDTGPLGWLGNIGIGALKEVRDMVTGLGVGLWRVGFEFLIKDVGGDILGLGCKLISFGQACKGSSWVPLHNTVESTVNFGKKLLPTAWAGVKDLFGNGWSCISGSGARGDNRAQMCGRTVLSIASLFVPATKAGTAGKLGAAVSKAAEGTRFAGVVAKGGELASTI
ncbi:MAG: hypothetical protein KC417_17960, partial [Myxococcales bacterium]|nr:hypothetical protein [Myxococcales bacterium]